MTEKQEMDSRIEEIKWDDKSEVASHVVYENIMKNKKAKNICVKK